MRCDMEPKVEQNIVRLPAFVIIFESLFNHLAIYLLLFIITTSELHFCLQRNSQSDRQPCMLKSSY